MLKKHWEGRWRQNVSISQMCGFAASQKDSVNVCWFESWKEKLKSRLSNESATYWEHQVHPEPYSSVLDTSGLVVPFETPRECPGMILSIQNAIKCQQYPLCEWKGEFSDIPSRQTRTCQNKSSAAIRRHGPPYKKKSCTMQRSRTWSHTTVAIGTLQSHVNCLRKNFHMFFYYELTIHHHHI